MTRAMSAPIRFRSAATTALGISPSPATARRPATLTASVRRPVAWPRGQVQFFEEATLLGTAPLVNGVATFQTSALALGPHRLLAAFAGSNGSFSPSVSPAVPLVPSSRRRRCRHQPILVASSIVGDVVTLRWTIPLDSPGTDELRAGRGRQPGRSPGQHPDQQPLPDLRLLRHPTAHSTCACSVGRCRSRSVRRTRSNLRQDADTTFASADFWRAGQFGSASASARHRHASLAASNGNRAERSGRPVTERHSRWAWPKASHTARCPAARIRSMCQPEHFRYECGVERGDVDVPGCMLGRAAHPGQVSGAQGSCGTIFQSCGTRHPAALRRPVMC